MEIWHPFTHSKRQRHPLKIVRGEGVYLFDAEDRAYIDGISSWWVNLHGHANPVIVKALTEQAKVLEHVLLAEISHPPAIELAQKLIQIVPGNMAKVFYSDNGSTAVEVAIKISLQHAAKKNMMKVAATILCLKGGYHGDTFGAMSVAGRNQFNKPFWNYLFAVEEIDIFSNEVVARVKELLHQENIACFIFEPLVLGAGGMKFYSKLVLEEICDLCRQKGVLLVADEVMTGFGRTGGRVKGSEGGVTGNLFASEQLNIFPDIICLSKGITGGFLPLGATLVQQAIYDSFEGDIFYHGHSYTGNPLACACAIASLDLLLGEESLRQRILIEELHCDFVRMITPEYPQVVCSSLGTILRIEYPVSPTIRDQLYTFFLDRAILLRPLANVLYLMPPYCITKEQLEYIYRTIEESFLLCR